MGWHKETVNESLLKYGERLTGAKQESCPAQSLRWFVPLCGKSVDMAYLARQETTAEVVGNDGIRKALDEFADMHKEFNIVAELQKSSPPSDPFEKLSGRKITLLKGDFFALDDRATGGKFDAVMDRASIVAIDPSLREDYVKIMSKLVKPGGKILLVTVDRRAGEEEARKLGPPFSVDEAEVRRLYESQDWVDSVTLLEEEDYFAKDPESKERYEGLTSMYELSFLITAKE